MTIAGTWADTDAQTQQDVSTLADFQNWTGDIDLAVGGTAVNSSESYAEAAKGTYLARWKTMAQNIQRYRGNSQGATYVRPWHEFNGGWYSNWTVTPSNADDYKASFRLMAKTLRENCPSCIVVWSPNDGSDHGANAAPIDQAYPGDDVVDVVSVDSYNANGNPVVTSQQAWDQYANSMDGANPHGVETWRQWAEKHGKPIAFSEWGLRKDLGGGDNPEYIQYMNAWMTQHAAKPGDAAVAGKVLYDVYFNYLHTGRTDFLIKDGPNPNAGRAYQSLRWGTTSTTSTAGATPRQLQDVVFATTPGPTSNPTTTAAPTTSAAGGQVAPPLPATGAAPTTQPTAQPTGPTTAPTTAPTTTTKPTTVQSTSS